MALSEFSCTIQNLPADQVGVVTCEYCDRRAIAAFSTEFYPRMEPIPLCLAHALEQLTEMIGNSQP